MIDLVLDLHCPVHREEAHLAADRRVSTAAGDID